MSRFLKIAIVLLAIAAMAAPVTVMAEDMLSLGGQMRVRGWYTDYDGDDYTTSWIDQRLRIGGKLSVADGVSITFRTDITEKTWGDGGSEYGAGRGGDTQQWDRAHIDLTKGNVHVRVGQQYAGFGLAQTINSQDAGIRVDFKGPVAVSAYWLLDDQNDDADFGSTSDSYSFALNAGFKGDNYKSNLFFGGDTKTSSVDKVSKLKTVYDSEVYLVGADVTFNLEALKIAAELDYFTGDADTDVDAMGLQFFLDAAFAASEAMTVGAEFYYAQGADDDEVQFTYLGNDFNAYDPLFDLGTSLSNEQIGVNRPFDFTEDNAGAIGARLYLKAKANDALSFGASIAYLEPEEDDNTDLDSALFYAVAVKYAVMANTSLQAQLQYIDADIDDESDDSAILGGVGLFVNF